MSAITAHDLHEALHEALAPIMSLLQTIAKDLASMKQDVREMKLLLRRGEGEERPAWSNGYDPQSVTSEWHHDGRGISPDHHPSRRVGKRELAEWWICQHVELKKKKRRNFSREYIETVSDSEGENMDVNE
jgi:hypothetical protein